MSSKRYLSDKNTKAGAVMRSAKQFSPSPLAKAIFFAGLALPMSSAFAQSANEQPIEEIIVSGARATVQQSLDLKRETTAIVDGLVASDIGEIPAFSVAEAIETITGATGHRLKGSASEISIRGLGPFLGFSTFNGRPVTQGGNNRAVNFQQFPSELVNKITVYKSQQADLTEGGTSGIVELGSIRALDYGKSTTQVNINGMYNEKAASVDGNDGLGYRGSITHINQFETDIGDMGFSIGYQRFDSGNPEETYLTSSSYFACDRAANAAVPNTTRCANVTPESFAEADGAIDIDDVYYPSSSRSFRFIDEFDKRDAVMASFQWQPDDRWDINADVQWSEKYYIEDRHDWIIDDARVSHSNVVIGDGPKNRGAVLSYDGRSRSRITGEHYNRAEDYLGGGLNVSFQATDRLTLIGDISSSSTHRLQQQNVASFRSEFMDYSFDGSTTVPAVTIHTEGYDINNPDTFGPNGRLQDAWVRRRTEDRKDDIVTAKFDAIYDLNTTGITSIKSGIQLVEQTRVTDKSNDNQLNYAAVRAEYYGDLPLGEQPNNMDIWTNVAAQGCWYDRFPQGDFLDSSSGSNVGGSFAVFDTLCTIRAVTGVGMEGGVGPLIPPEADSRSFDDVDVKETTTAAYVMADFDTNFAGVPFYGNFGTRIVQTDVDSRGYTQDIVIEQNNDELWVTNTSEVGIRDVRRKHSYTELLPSATGILELQDDVLFRTAVYRAMTRVNIEDLHSGRTMGDFSENEAFESRELAIADLTSNISGGNAAQDPLMSWNLDFSIEWFQSRDTALSLALYAKQFEAGFQTLRFDETLVIDGEVIPVSVRKRTNSDDSSLLTGMEITATHRFSNLPAPFDGLGIQMSYNYADSDFKNADPVLGEILDEEGNLVAPGLTPDASLWGFSRHVASTKVYWDIGDFTFTLTNKYRSQYFQPTAGNPANRFIDGFNYVDLSARYRINKTWDLRAYAYNVTEESQVGRSATREDNVRLYSHSGRKFELALRAKF
jgi:TonB-dependent receptor